MEQKANPDKGASPDLTPVDDAPEPAIVALPDQHFIRVSPSGHVTHAVTVRSSQVTRDDQVQIHAEVVNADGSPIVGADGEPLNWHPAALTPDRGFRPVDEHVVSIGHREQAGGAFAAAAPRSPRMFALVINDVVREIIREREHIENELHPDFVKMLVDVSGADPAVELGWVRRGDGSLAPAPPYVPTRDEAMRAAISSGLQITVASKPALSGTYAASGPAWQGMLAEVTYITSFGSFSAGRTELTWQTATGEVTFRSIDDFKSVVRAIADWLASWNLYAAEKTESAPDAIVAI